MGKFKQSLIQALDEENYFKYNGYFRQGAVNDKKTNDQEKKFDSKRVANQSSLQTEEGNFFKKVQS